jgi:hypothetical protein
MPPAGFDQQVVWFGAAFDAAGFVAVGTVGQLVAGQGVDQIAEQVPRADRPALAQKEQR